MTHSLTLHAFAFALTSRLLGAPPGAASDAGSPLTPAASLQCPPVPAPGRVLCTVEAQPGAGDSIQWGDFVIVSTSPSLSALRGRIGPHEATLREPSVWRWPFGLVARQAGQGVVEGRVRLVVCRASVCLPVELAVSATVVVGQ